LQFNLTQGFTLLFNSERDLLKDAKGDGRHVNFINLVTAGHEAREECHALCRAVVGHQSGFGGDDEASVGRSQRF